MKLLLENWRRFLNESVEDRRMQILKTALVLTKFKRSGSQGVFERKYSSNMTVSDFEFGLFVLMDANLFSQGEIEQLAKDLRDFQSALLQAGLGKPESPKDPRFKKLASQYSLPARVEITPEIARGAAKLFSKIPLDEKQPMYRGISLEGVDSDYFMASVIKAANGSKSELVKLIKENVHPRPKDRAGFSSFSSNEGIAASYAGGSVGGGTSLQMPNKDGSPHEHFVQAGRFPGLILYLKNPQFGLILQKDSGEEEVLIPYWNFKEPLEENIIIDTDFRPKGTEFEFRYERKKTEEDLTYYSIVKVMIDQ